MIYIKKKIKLALFVIAFFVISIVVIFYAKGDILTDGWDLLKTGGIYVDNAPIGSNVSINSKFKDNISFFQRIILIKNLRPGTYKVLVEKEGYNSWTKTIKVIGNIVSDANVFILSKEPVLKEIPMYLSTTTKEKNEEYWNINNLFASSTKIVSKKVVATSTIDFKGNLGTKYSPIMNGKLGIWKEDNKIFIGWFGKEDYQPNYFCDQKDCKDKLLVYTFPSSPSKIDFFPGRDDVVIGVWGGDVFAVQVEENSEKAAQFIYHGTKPDFLIRDGLIYIKDKNYIAEVVLE